MLKLFSKKTQQALVNKNKTLDNLESSLWDIKEEYDFETEEIERVVSNKRELEEHRNEEYLKKK